MNNYSRTLENCSCGLCEEMSKACLRELKNNSGQTKNRL